jgi:hypothetical protein
VTIVRRPKATPIHELERYLVQGLLAAVGPPVKRSHLVSLRPTRISAMDTPSVWWPGER